jgi:hypothetical protein
MKFEVKFTHLGYVLACIFFLFTLHEDIFERKFLFNELLSASGMLTFLIFYFREGTLKIPSSPLFVIVFLFLALGIVYIIFSFPFQTKIYYLFRNSVIVYSVLTFFVGYFFFDQIHAFIKKIKYVFIAYLTFVFTIGGTLFLNRYMASVLTPMLFKRISLSLFIFIVIFNTFYANFYGQTTSVAIILISFFVFVNRYYGLFKLYVWSMIVVYFLLFFYFRPNLELYRTGEYELHGNMEAVVLSHPVLMVDPNLTYRLVYQYRAIFDRFPENLIGIGFGTPIMPYNEGVRTSAQVGTTDEYEAHVSGVHNTFVTVFLRMGVPFLIILIAIYSIVYRNYYRYRKRLSENGLFIYFWAFTILSVFGLFNLLLETPTYAAVYWVLLGMIAKIIYNLKQLPA